MKGMNVHLHVGIIKRRKRKVTQLMPKEDVKKERS